MTKVTENHSYSYCEDKEIAYVKITDRTKYFDLLIDFWTTEDLDTSVTDMIREVNIHIVPKYARQGKKQITMFIGNNKLYYENIPLSCKNDLFRELKSIFEYKDVIKELSDLDKELNLLGE